MIVDGQLGWGQARKEHIMAKYNQQMGAIIKANIIFKVQEQFLEESSLRIQLIISPTSEGSEWVGMVKWRKARLLILCIYTIPFEQGSGWHFCCQRQNSDLTSPGLLQEIDHLSVTLSTSRPWNFFPPVHHPAKTQEEEVVIAS